MEAGGIATMGDVSVAGLWEAGGTVTIGEVSVAGAWKAGGPTAGVD